jgi:YVTN family beta-propeller protein
MSRGRSAGRLIWPLCACALLAGVLGAGAAGAAAAPTAYVTNQTSDDVTPIDLASNAAGTPIPVGVTPFGIAITPPPPPPPPPPPGPSRAELAALRPPANGGICAPLPARAAPAKRPPARFTLSASQFLINQRIYQAAIRRANAIEAWLSAGIEARDVCGGALGVDRFAASVGFVAAGGPRPAARPRPLTVAPPGRQDAGAERASAALALINQRIAQAAILRANALGERIGGRLTGGDIKDAQLTNGQLVAGLGFGAPGGAPSPPASVTNVGRRTGGDPGAVTLSAAQLRINQRIGQQAVRRVNALVDDLASGLVGASFAPGAIGGSEVARP